MCSHIRASSLADHHEHCLLGEVSAARRRRRRRRAHCRKVRPQTGYLKPQMDLPGAETCRRHQDARSHAGGDRSHAAASGGRLGRGRPRPREDSRGEPGGLDFSSDFKEEERSISRCSCPCDSLHPVTASPSAGSTLSDSVSCTNTATVGKVARVHPPSVVAFARSIISSLATGAMVAAPCGCLTPAGHACAS